MSFFKKKKKSIQLKAIKNTKKKKAPLQYL